MTVKLKNMLGSKRNLAVVAVLLLLILLVSSFVYSSPNLALGDINGDGKVDVNDVVLVMKHVLGIPPALTAAQQAAADVNGDGKIDVNDVNQIMQKSLGLIDEFPMPVVSVEDVILYVAQGTALADIDFPSTVKATLKDNSLKNIDVKWAATSTPGYNPLAYGSYEFKGDLINLPSGVTNPGKLTAKLTVIISTPWTPQTPTVINIAAIPGVTAPVTGEIPVTAITETHQYTGTVTWSPAQGTFTSETVYTATITLTPKAGFTLTGVTADFFTVAGAISVSNAANSGVVTAVFPATYKPVHNVNQNTFYDTIQDAIDVAYVDDEIWVAAGVYEEDPDINKKGIIIKAVGNLGSTIKGLITITADGVTLDGFKMREYQVAGGGDPVIDIDAEDVTVQNMDLYLETFVSVQPYEINVQAGSHNAQILNNIVDRGWVGGHPAIRVAEGANNVLIEGNKVAENGASAIAAGVGDGCTITFKDNTVYNGYDEGIWFWPVHENGIIVVEGNTVVNYSVGNPGKKALKVVSKPATINGETETLAMYDAILDDNPGVDSVELSWMKDVHNVTQDTFYDTIQTAITAAVEDDTILVNPGIYEEDVDVNVEDLTLKSTGGWDQTKIKAQAGGETGALSIGASGVTVDGFTIEGKKKTVRVPVATTDVTFVNNKVVTGDNAAEENGWSGFEVHWDQEQTGLVIDNNVFVANKTAQLFYSNKATDIVFTDNMIEGVMWSPGLPVGLGGLDGDQNISGNTFDTFSEYALLEVKGNYDMDDLLADNFWPQGGVIFENKILNTLIGIVYYSESITLNGGSDLEITVTDAGDWLEWCFDFPVEGWTGDGKISLGLVIATDGVGQGPAFQIHNNDGTDATYAWGDWLYSQWGPTIGDGWNGWHSGTDNTPVGDLLWVEASGERDAQGTDGKLCVKILKSELGSSFHWAAKPTVGTGWSGIPTQYLATPASFDWASPIVAADNYHELTLP